MSGFAVYGLRERGSKELRYVGQTNNPGERLAGHINAAQKSRCPDALRDWVLASADCLELVVLHECSTRNEARAMEKSLVQAFFLCGRRLFNLRLVPCDCLPVVQISDLAAGLGEAA